MTQFSDPSQGGDSLKPSDVLGHLLIVRPLEHVFGIVTTFGEKDAIRCDVGDVTANEIHKDVLWFPGGLVGSLKNSIGSTILATMTQGTAKPGQSAPWMLAGASADPAAVAKASAWLDVNGPTFNGLAPAAAAAPAAVAAPVI